jgi:UDP-N-acetylglucosamine/UDP-N-acetylgalactosamine 4-epimerase
VKETAVQSKELKGITVLVTGGAGFIGSHLVDALLAVDAKVRVLDNFETGRRENLEHVADRVEIIEADIRDLDSCLRACSGIQYVLHQAALGSVPRSMAEPATSLSVNVSGTANVFTAARDCKVKRVVYASSSSVYGDSERLPKMEGEEGSPLSPYAVSKWIDEELADVFERCFEMQLVGLRYFNVYGPRQDPNGPYAAVIPRFFACCRSGKAPIIFGGGDQSRDFTYVSDVVQANLLAMTASTGSGRAYNVGAGQRTTVKELAEVIIRITGFEGHATHEPPRPGDVLHSLADARAIREAFGWVATTSVADGLMRSAEHY